MSLSPKLPPASGMFLSAPGDEVLGFSGMQNRASLQASLNQTSATPGSAMGRSAILNTASPQSILPANMDREVSELDGAAYGKEELNGEQQKNVMARLFEAFDMQHEGFLNAENQQAFLDYLSGGSNKDHHLQKALGERQQLTFADFWVWWTTYDDKNEAFAIAKSNFAAPFHQQQLLVSESGDKYQPNYRVHFHFKDVETGEVREISPWHDLPLKVNDIVRTTPADRITNKYNFLCEIPKWTRAKFEISTKESMNPIKQDMKNGLPRFYKHGDMMWNYGAFPQTWESTELTFVEGVKGDNDPVDAIEIGMVQLGTGQVQQVKILGVLGMIDAGEMDWKVICINRKDPIAKFLDDIHDVPKHLPGCLDAIREWLRTYKICQGGKENTFAFDGEYKDKAYAMRVVDESHRMWKNLKLIKQTSEV